MAATGRYIWKKPGPPPGSEAPVVRVTGMEGQGLKITAAWCAQSGCGDTPKAHCSRAQAQGREGPATADSGPPLGDFKNASSREVPTGRGRGWNQS